MAGSSDPPEAEQLALPHVPLEPLTEEDQPELFRDVTDMRMKEINELVAEIDRLRQSLAQATQAGAPTVAEMEAQLELLQQALRDARGEYEALDRPQRISQTERKAVDEREWHPPGLSTARLALANEPGLYDNLVTSVWLDWRNLQHCPEVFRGERSVVLKAIAQSNGLAFQFASEELRADRDLVMTVMKMNGLVLQYASEELRSDRNFIIEACKRDGSALKYAADTLRDDREVVMTAVSQNGANLVHASERWLSDYEMLLAATEKEMASSSAKSRVATRESDSSERPPSPPRERTLLACQRNLKPNPEKPRSDYDMLLNSFAGMSAELELLKVETERRERKFDFLKQVW